MQPIDLWPFFLNEVTLYLAFFAGQCLFILKRMSYAIRSTEDPASTRRDYLQRNWDVLLIRAALDWAVFIVWQHGDLSGFLAAHLNFYVPPLISSSPATAAALGYCSDSGMDWFLTMKLMPDWLKRVIPMVPANGGNDRSGRRRNDDSAKT